MTIRPSSIRTGATLLAIVLALPTRADELRTLGGEVLIGRVVEEQPDHVVFDSGTFGRLTVPRKDIATLTISAPQAPAETESAQAEPAQAKPATTAAQKARAESARVEEAQAAERRAMLDKDAVGRFLARINPLKGWKTALHFGLITRRGDTDNDNDLTFDLKSTRRTEADNEHLIEVRYYYAEDVLGRDHTRTTDQLLTGGYRYRRPLRDPLFVQARTSYYRDAIKQLDHRVTQTVGVGLQLDRPRWKSSLTPVIGAQWRQVDSEEDSSVVAGFYFDAAVNLTSTLRLTPTLDYLVAVDDSDDYSTRLGVDLIQKLGSAWSLGLRYEYTYDSVVGKNASEEQQRWSLTVGLEF